MEKISPPLRIAIVAVLLFAVAWFLVLRPKPPAEPAAPPPGIGGLSNDVKRAQNATATADSAAASAQNAAASVDGAPGATGSTAAGATATATKSASATATTSKGTTVTATRTTTKKAAAKPAPTAAAAPRPAAKPKAAAPARPAKPKAPADPAAPLVAALGRGKAVILVFRSRSSDSQAVADAVRAVPKQVRRVVVRVAPIGQVGRYATFTEKTQISQAPTVLIIGPGRRAKVIVGYTSTAEVAEAVRDLRRAARR